MKTDGQVGYETYRAGVTDLIGQELLPWELISESKRSVWEAVGAAIRRNGVASCSELGAPYTHGGLRFEETVPYVHESGVIVPTMERKE